MWIAARAWAGKQEGRELVVVVRWNAKGDEDKGPGTRHRVRWEQR